MKKKLSKKDKEILAELLIIKLIKDKKFFEEGRGELVKKIVTNPAIWKNLKSGAKWTVGFGTLTGATGALQRKKAYEEQLAKSQSRNPMNIAKDLYNKASQMPFKYKAGIGAGIGSLALLAYLLRQRNKNKDEYI